jgi:hypothetical protein
METLAALTESFGEFRLLFTVALLERFIGAGNKEAVLGVGRRHAITDLRAAREYVTGLPSNPYATRHATIFEAKLTAELEQCVEKGRFGEIVLLVEHLGAATLPNHIRYAIPAAIEQRLRVLRNIEREIEDAQSTSGSSKPAVEWMTAEFHDMMREAQALGQMVGGDDAPSKIFKTYLKRK